MEESIMNRRKKHAQLSEFWRRFRKNKAAVLGLVLLVLIIGMAVFADLIVPYSKCIEQVGADRLQGPSLKHFFGTDELGRDLFARIVHGSRYSLLIGLATSLMALVVGAILGASAGYFGGVVDNVISRIMDVFMCVPPILLSLAVVAALGTKLTKSDHCDYRFLYSGKCPTDPFGSPDNRRAGLRRGSEILRNLQCENYFSLCTAECNGTDHCKYNHEYFRYDALCSRTELYRNGYPAAVTGMGGTAF